MHPPPAKQADQEPIRFYPSLEDCESANDKLYGGAGRCHCFSDRFTERGNDWRFSPESLNPPMERIP
jgi:hypothetical protein